jgi:hypothetical protein
MFSQKKKKQKKLNTSKFLRDFGPKKRKTARVKSQNAAKAWAVKLIARLGHIRPKTL